MKLWSISHCCWYTPVKQPLVGSKEEKQTIVKKKKQTINKQVKRDKLSKLHSIKIDLNFSNLCVSCLVHLMCLFHLQKIKLQEKDTFKRNQVPVTIPCQMILFMRLDSGRIGYICLEPFIFSNLYLSFFIIYSNIIMFQLNN